MATGKSIRLGGSTRYDSGAVTQGIAPAKASGGSLTPAQGKLIGRWTLPVDSRLSNVAGFTMPVSAGDPVAFPVGASPDENLGKVSKWQIESYQVGQLVDAWVVTRDKYGAPANPTSSNALYLGRNKISSTKQQSVGSAAFL